MGTNYYARHALCSHCSRHERWHIGKSSAGWKFHWNGHRGSPHQPDTVAGWWVYLEDHPECIVDEYDHPVSLDAFKALVESKRDGRTSFGGYFGHLDVEGNYITYDEFS